MGGYRSRISKDAFQTSKMDRLHLEKEKKEDAHRAPFPLEKEKKA